MDVLKVEAIRQTLQRKLVPVERASELVDIVEGERPGALQAAVLLPLYVVDGQVSLIFIKRASTLRTHSGEIAFPGGKVDSSDSSLVVTALREAQEEIGLKPELVSVLGVLPPVFTVVSNFLITPIVGLLEHGLGQLQLAESEVAELITVPLERLADPQSMHTEKWVREDKIRTIYFYDYDRYRIWGATGRIVATLLALLSSENEKVQAGE